VFVLTEPLRVELTASDSLRYPVFSSNKLRVTMTDYFFSVTGSSNNNGFCCIVTSYLCLDFCA